MLGNAHAGNPATGAQVFGCPQCCTWEWLRPGHCAGSTSACTALSGGARCVGRHLNCRPCLRKQDDGVSQKEQPLCLGSGQQTSVSRSHALGRCSGLMCQCMHEQRNTCHVCQGGAVHSLLPSLFLFAFRWGCSAGLTGFGLCCTKPTCAHSTNTIHTQTHTNTRTHTHMLSGLTGSGLAGVLPVQTGA